MPVTWRGTGGLQGVQEDGWGSKVHVAQGAFFPKTGSEPKIMIPWSPCTDSCGFKPTADSPCSRCRVPYAAAAESSAADGATPAVSPATTKAHSGGCIASKPHTSPLQAPQLTRLTAEAALGMRPSV